MGSLGFLGKCVEVCVFVTMGIRKIEGFRDKFFMKEFYKKG